MPRNHGRQNPDEDRRGLTAESRRSLADNYYIRELEIWNPFRMFGLGCSFVGLALTVVAIFNREWLVQTSGHKIGIWDTCYYNKTKICMEKFPNWQNAVIGLLVFSVAFGFLATILTICGFLTTALPKKIYYFHSAGEIYFVCAVGVMVALVVYPAAIAIEQKVSTHTYGVGFGLGWGAVFFFLVAALCMCLDDVVRNIARCCCPPSDRDSNL